VWKYDYSREPSYFACEWQYSYSLPGIVVPFEYYDVITEGITVKIDLLEA